MNVFGDSEHTSGNYLSECFQGNNGICRAWRIRFEMSLRLWHGKQGKNTEREDSEKSIGMHPMWQISYFSVTTLSNKASLNAS